MPLIRSKTLGTTSSVEVSPSVTIPPRQHNRSASFAATVAIAGSSPFASSSSNLSYVSIKDIMSAPGSPGYSPRISSSAEINIRHELLKQAAWAYCRPMPCSPTSDLEHCIRRVVNNPFFSLIRAATRAVADAFVACII